MKLSVNSLPTGRSLILIVALLFTTFRLTAQKEVEYINPPLMSSDYYTIEIKEILATAESFKFELVIDNKSNDKVLLLDPSKIAIYFNDVAYYPVKSGLIAKVTSKEDPEILIAPKSKKKETVTVEGNANFRLDAVKIVIPNMRYNGSLQPAPTLPAYTVNALPKVVDPAIGDVNITELEFKKTKWTGKLDLVRNSTNEIILVDLTKIKSISKTGAQLTTTAKSPLGINKYDFNNEKIALKPNVDYKLSLTIDDLEGSLTEISLADVFERYSIAELTVAPITVRRVGSDVAKVEPPKSTPPPVQQSATPVQQSATPVQQSATPVQQSQPVQQTQQYSSSNSQCAPFVGNPAAGKVKVTFYNNDGYCFEVLSPGSSYTNGPTNSATIYFNYGKANIIIKMNGAVIITDEIKNTQNMQSVSYMIKEKKGVWSLDRQDMEITPEAQARMDQMQADSKAWHEQNKKESEEWHAEQSAKHQTLVDEMEKDDDEGSSSSQSSGTSGGGSGTSGGGSGNSKVSGSGSTTFTLTYKGTPVCNTQISFIQGGSTVASGTTNDDGSFKSDFNGAIGVAFTVKGQKGNTTWEIKDFYALPNNDPEIGLRLEDFEKQMDEMTKMVGEEDSQMGALMGGFTTAVSVASWGVVDGCK
ncbi:MAG TPA: hypothetical protein VK151_06270 [Fluviicola sp.]|nr:hypothetical protein [Fluviicola sp.]